jgi:hypothetical protein
MYYFGGIGLRLAEVAFRIPYRPTLESAEVSMTDKHKRQGYITALQYAIWRMHGSESVHVQTVYLLERFEGETVWDGDVEVFDLVGHPNAKRAYAWTHTDGPKGDQTGFVRFVAILEIPPVKDAKRAVQASIMAGSNNG